MKPEAKAPLEHLIEETSSSILGISDDQPLIHLEDELSIDETDTCDIDGTVVETVSTTGTVVQP